MVILVNRDSSNCLFLESMMSYKNILFFKEKRKRNLRFLLIILHGLLNDSYD